MKRLIKLSEPGWIREFESEEDLKAELYKCICVMCREGDGVTEDSTIDWMLWTACGCEYTVDDGED